MDTVVPDRSDLRAMLSAYQSMGVFMNVHGDPELHCPYMSEYSSSVTVKLLGLLL